MKYYYRQGGYESYRPKKKGGGGAIAAVLAMVIVFAAGFLIGGANQWNLFAPGGTSSSVNESTSSGGTSSTDTSSKPTQSITLPNDLQYVERPQENTPGNQIGAFSTVTAGSYMVIDRLTGAVLLEKNANAKLYPGSTTQIMTAALALEKGQLTDSLTTTSFALGVVGTGSERIGLRKGQTITMQNALSAMLLGSAADAANVIADHFGYNGFVAEMVTRAKQLGCTGTYFVSPNGTHSTVHFTTVTDLVRMEAYAHKNNSYRALAMAEQAVLSADNLNAADGWRVVQDADVLAGLRTLLANDARIVAVETTYTGVTTQGYTLVCTAVTAGGAQLTAAMGGIPYQNGNGAAACLPQMAALLCEAAKTADAADAVVSVSNDAELDEKLSGGVSKVLPVGAKLVAAHGFRLTKGTALQNGDTAIFADPSVYTMQITYYDDLQRRLEDYRRGQSVEVGYLSVTDANGQSAVSDIPVYLQ